MSFKHPFLKAKLRIYVLTRFVPDLTVMFMTIQYDMVY